MIFIYITCKDKTEAQKIGETLVKEKLAACVNFWPIQSIYRWHRKIVKDKEFILVVKTLKSKFRKIEARVKELHSYQVPCLVGLAVSKISQKYFNWLKRETE